MQLTEEDVRRFVLAWCGADQPSVAELLGDEFEFLGAVLRHGKESFLAQMQISAKFENVRILGVLVGATQAAAFFEVVDPTTALLHRVAWLLEHHDRRVARVVETACILAS